MYSSVVYTGDGAITDFVVPFPYLDPSHVTATVNGVSASFSWLGASTIRISPAPGNALEVRISRNSSRATRLSNYQDAQLLTEAQMDFDALQIFYVAQEAYDAVASAAAGGDMRRSFNLSDVFDPNAARQNIGAVAKSGDTMTGPLVLSGPPAAPNHATNKAYVDALLGLVGASGVSAFNGRTGAITLLPSDVTAALDFTPVNKAGDTMLGTLTLAADPVNPLQAATKQYVDANVGGGGGAGTGEYIFGAPSTTLAAARLDKIVSANTTDSAGSAKLQLVRNAGNVPMVGFSHSYTVRGAATGSGDIGLASRIVGLAGTYAATWSAAWGPRSSPGSAWQPVGATVLVSERVSDQGLKRDRTGNPTVSLQVAPGHPMDVGDGAPIAYNTSFGLAFTLPAASTQRMWVPLYFEQDSTATGGIQALHRGGSSPATAPLTPMEVRDHFKYGIDFRSATFNDPAGPSAIYLAQGQQITMGASGQCVYVDGGGNLSFFDPVAGVKTLNALGGGAGTNILPLNNVWTGVNKFNGAFAEVNLAGDPSPSAMKVSRTAPPGGPVAVQSGLLVNTVTQASTAGFEWNALFRMDNFATAGENVAIYTKGEKHSTGPTWAAVFEARDHNGSGDALYGVEVDLCADGLDPGQNHIGLAVYYGANTNTFGAGAATKQTYGIRMAPFSPGRNALANAIKVEGYADYTFHTVASGLAAFRAAGAYSSTVIDIASVTNSPIAIAFGPGSRMHFQSGIGNVGNQSWFAGGFVPNFVGAIEVLIDGTKRYIPIALNHP